MRKLFKRKERKTLQDRIYGGFKFHVEPDHIKVCTPSDMVSWRVSRDSIAGRIIEIGIDDNDENGLHNYAAVMHYALSIAPDVDFLTQVIDAANACIERHKELYPSKPDISKEEDDKIVEEEKAMQEEIDNLTKDK